MVEIVPVTMTITAANGEPVTTTVEMTREQYAAFISTPEVQFVRKRQRDRFDDFLRSLPKIDTMPKHAPNWNYLHDFMVKELKPELGLSIPATIDENGELYVHWHDSRLIDWEGYIDRANTAGLIRLWQAHRKALSRKES